MNKRHIEGLRSIGITKKNYYGERDGFRIGYETRERVLGPAPCWGIELIKNGQRIALITHTSRAHGGDGKHYIRRAGWSDAPPVGAVGYKRQLDAVAMFIREMYDISDAEVAERHAQQRRASLRTV